MIDGVAKENSPSNKSKWIRLFVVISTLSEKESSQSIFQICTDGVVVFGCSLTAPVDYRCYVLVSVIGPAIGYFRGPSD